jgi:hypothetical protein
MSLKEDILIAIADGHMNLRDLYEKFPRASRSSIRGTVNKMVKAGELERLGTGEYVTTKKAQVMLGLEGPSGDPFLTLMVNEVASLTRIDLLVVYNLRADALSEEDLVDLCGEGTKESLAKLIDLKYVVKSKGVHILTPKGAFLSSFLYNLHYLMIRSRGNPSFEDGEVALHELARVYEIVSKNLNPMRDALDHLQRVLEVADREVSKLARLFPATGLVEATEE